MNCFKIAEIAAFNTYCSLHAQSTIQMVVNSMFTEVAVILVGQIDMES